MIINRYVNNKNNAGNSQLCRELGSGEMKNKLLADQEYR